MEETLTPDTAVKAAFDSTLQAEMQPAPVPDPLYPQQEYIEVAPSHRVRLGAIRPGTEIYLSGSKTHYECQPSGAWKRDTPKVNGKHDKRRRRKERAARAQ